MLATSEGNLRVLTQSKGLTVKIFVASFNGYESCSSVQSIAFPCVHDWVYSQEGEDCIILLIYISDSRNKVEMKFRNARNVHLTGHTGPM